MEVWNLSERTTMESFEAHEEVVADLELEAWLASLPPALSLVARRHGRDVFQFVMTCGTASFALGQLAGPLGRNPHLMQAVGVLQKMFDGLAQEHIKAKGWSLGFIGEVHMDVERASALALVEPGKTKGGIILAH